MKSNSKKTWTKKKNTVFFCGNCQWCNKELTSDMGGWIVNAEKKHFCHNGLDGSCFDKYCESKSSIEDSGESSAA
jgi:hypothetical protein